MGRAVLRLLCAAVLTAAVNSAELDKSANPGDTQYCSPLPDASNPPAQPSMPDRFTTKVESSVILVSDPSIRAVDYSEQVYDRNKNMIAFHYNSKDSLVRYTLNWNTQQLIYVSLAKPGSNMKECTVRPLKDSITLFPALIASNTPLPTDQIVNPEVMVGVLDWGVTHYKGKFYTRGMRSQRWDWCGLAALEQEMGTQNVTMATHWSDSEWRMPVERGVSVPLGYEVELRSPDPQSGLPMVTHTNVYHVMSYKPDVVDYTSFLIPDGVYCSNRLPDPDLPFPDYSKDKLFTFSLEFRETAVNTFSWADAWYDFEKQLYRIDHDVLNTPREVLTTSEIFDFNDGIVYTIPRETVEECVIKTVNDSRSDWADITGIAHLWGDNPNSFFGSDITNYTYYGQGVVRYLAGQEWRGNRVDWPPNPTSGDTHTTWQWTFSNKNVSVLTDMGHILAQERMVPIGLRVTADHDIHTSMGTVHSGSAFVYQLYNFQLQTELRWDVYSNAWTFDIVPCYSENWRDHLRFKLDVTDWPEVVESPLFSSVGFKEHWQKQLAYYGTVSLIRISRVETIFEAVGEVYVAFYLLYRHPTISQIDENLYAHMTPGSKARSYITAAVNNGDIKFEGQTTEGESFVLSAIPGTLADVIEPDCTDTTVSKGPTTTTTTVTKGPTTSTTPSATTTEGNHITNTGTTDVGGSSTPTTQPPTVPPQGKTYSPGDMAGLGVGMLITGLAMGAGGTFLVVVKQLHLTVLGWCGKGQ